MSRTFCIKEDIFVFSTQTGQMFQNIEIADNIFLMTEKEISYTNRHKYIHINYNSFL